MTTPKDTKADAPRHQAYLERRALRIARGRFVVLGISTALFAVAIAGAVVMRVFDEKDFPSFGLALWWAVQTFTTVGYGDIVPSTDLGRIAGGIVMVIGIMFISFLTAIVTTALIERRQREREAAARAKGASELAEVLAGIDRLERRLEEFESRRTATGN